MTADRDLSMGPEVRDHLMKFLMQYRFGIDEVMTKLRILNEEAAVGSGDNPIDHITSRLKSVRSLMEKMRRRGIPADLEMIRENITDIAGIRVVCSFISDVYRVCDALVAQDDVRLLEKKDYIATPKPNGYRSLHVVVEIPVFLAEGPVNIPVEVQFRTVAMDFWASLEHKIFYKYSGVVPTNLVDTLTETAFVSAEQDERMESLYVEVRGMRSQETTEERFDIDEDLIRQFRDLIISMDDADQSFTSRHEE